MRDYPELIYQPDMFLKYLVLGSVCVYMYLFTLTGNMKTLEQRTHYFLAQHLTQAPCPPVLLKATLGSLLPPCANPGESLYPRRRTWGKLCLRAYRTAGTSALLLPGRQRALIF